MRKNVRNTLSRDRRFQMGPKASEILNEEGEFEADNSTGRFGSLSRSYMWMIKDDAKGKFLGCQATPKSEVSDQDMSGDPTLKTEVKVEPEDVSGRQFNNLQDY